MTKKAQKTTKKTHLFDIFMKIAMFLIFAFFLILLFGCAREAPVSETISENAVNATTALEKTLKPECKTEGISAQISVIKTEIRAAKSACQAEKDEITRDKLKWKFSFWALVGVIAAYIAKKVLR